MLREIRVPKLHDSAAIEVWLSRCGYRRTVHDTVIIYVRRTPAETDALRSLD
jgi:hypothetical protein